MPFSQEVCHSHGPLQLHLQAIKATAPYYRGAILISRFSEANNLPAKEDCEGNTKPIATGMFSLNLSQVLMTAMYG